MKQLYHSMLVLCGLLTISPTLLAVEKPYIIGTATYEGAQYYATSQTDILNIKALISSHRMATRHINIKTSQHFTHFVVDPKTKDDFKNMLGTGLIGPQGLDKKLSNQDKVILGTVSLRNESYQLAAIVDGATDQGVGDFATQWITTHYPDILLKALKKSGVQSGLSESLSTINEKWNTQQKNNLFFNTRPYKCVEPRITNITLSSSLFGKAGLLTVLASSKNNTLFVGGISDGQALLCSSITLEKSAQHTALPLYMPYQATEWIGAMNQSGVHPQTNQKTITINVQTDNFVLIVSGGVLNALQRKIPVITNEKATMVAIDAADKQLSDQELYNAAAEFAFKAVGTAAITEKNANTIARTFLELVLEDYNAYFIEKIKAHKATLEQYQHDDMTAIIIFIKN